MALVKDQPFMTVMGELQRMCSYNYDYGCKGDDGKLCPFYDENVDEGTHCRFGCFGREAPYIGGKFIAEIIIDWAAEHPDTTENPVP